ncbi:hypothetical protein [Coleofasciculus sp.]|uniref:hypothetical protein n=2 Tax=Coleofasciculus sp. TaxID=3100458 RepID=UPI003A40F0FA
MEQQNPPSSPINKQQNPPSSPINKQQNPPSPLGRVQSRTVGDSITFGRDRAPAMGMGSEQDAKPAAWLR